MYNLLSVRCVCEVAERNSYIGVPAIADINHHIIESINLLHSMVWRGVLGD